MGDTNQEKLENFAAVTGCTDETKGFSLLDAAGWDLATAIELFFASETDQSERLPQPAADEDPDAALARQLQQEDEESMRAPLPTKTERLYADVHHYHGQPQAYAGPQRESSSRAPKPPVDAFRDFKPEGEGSSRGPPQGPGLADLFSAPSDLIFPGSFEQAKNKAHLDDKWLLVNVQSSSEFGSHQLNRDTWKNDLVKDLLNGMFVFYQVYDVAQEGPRLMQAYRILELPVILVLDPITGACMFQKYGFVGPEALADHLVPYLDHGPSHIGSASLASHSTLKRKNPDKALTEDEELAKAIAASMNARPASSTDAAVMAAMESDDDGDEVELQQQLDKRMEEEQAAQSRRSPEEAMAEAEARLPTPPSDSDPAATRLAIRLPDGSRIPRSFSRQDPLTAVYDFCITKVPEAASGRAFTLVLPVPGAAPLTDKTLTLEAAGLVNAMLVLKWHD